jgi:4'-phosphopantetheinyl transferase EntD
MSGNCCAEQLFPPGAVMAVLREPGDPSLLYPEEAQCISRAVASRANEFAAGRQCARQALAEFGIVGFPLLAAPDRSPVWPAGIVGSISHTAGYCAVVTGRRTQFLGLGLDTEILTSVGEQLWSRLCTPPEWRRLLELPAAQRGRVAALTFAAKEAFYKAQYPMTREWLDFDAVEVDFDRPEGTGGDFEVVPVRTIALHIAPGERVRGRFAFHEIYVSAGVAFPAGN